MLLIFIYVSIVYKKITTTIICSVQFLRDTILATEFKLMQSKMVNADAKLLNANALGN